MRRERSRITQRKTSTGPLLFTSPRLGALTVRSRIVMASMTRTGPGRTVPTRLMARCYQQSRQRRAGRQLGHPASQVGKCCWRTPGIHGVARVAGWRKTARGVREIFIDIKAARRTTGSAVYRDHYRRNDGRWPIARTEHDRVLELVAPAGSPGASDKPLSRLGRRRPDACTDIGHLIAGEPA